MQKCRAKRFVMLEQIIEINLPSAYSCSRFQGSSARLAVGLNQRARVDLMQTTSPVTTDKAMQTCWNGFGMTAEELNLHPSATPQVCAIIIKFSIIIKFGQTSA